MSFPEGHVERVCLRGGTMCPYLVAIVDGVKRTKRYDCTKGLEGSTRFFEVMFAAEPEIIEAMNDARPVGNCSGRPAYIEYSTD